jgi:DNA-binding SARP family transcriptional activator
MLKVFLLGRFEVHLDGQPITRWGGRQTRDLVKVLAAARGQPVTRDQLVERLWNDPPPRAERDLKVLVSRGRRALGDDAHDRLVTTAAGYALGQCCWRDVDELERLVTQGAAWERAGRPALAEASYRAGLDLYVGPFLPEDLYADWVAPQRERCHRLYLDALLALGGLLFRRADREAIRLAERLLAADPYSDTGVQAVMLTRATFGDVSAALDAYARFSQRVLDELGASPGAETERLHIAILRGEPLGDWPRPWPARPASPSMRADRALVGRERELRALEQALERAAAGRPTVVVLTGEAGIGKSRLLEALRTLAQSRVHLLGAAGRERDRHLPFQLLAEAIRSLDVAPEVFQAATGPYADAIAELVPDLAPLAARAARPAMSQIARRRLLEGWLHLVRSLTERHPVLLILDDFHWADPSTVDAVIFCLRRVPGARLLCVLALRTGEGRAEADILECLPDVHRVDLTPLSTDDVRRLIGEAPPDVVDRIVAESAGIPFYVVEFMCSVREGSYQPAAVPSGIQRALRQRIRGVAARGRRVLDAAAVLGDGCSLDAVAALAGLPARAALDAAEDLVARRLLVDSAARPASYGFAHDLIRRSVYDAISPARRRFLHGKAADLHVSPDPAVVGRHALQAGQPEQAVALFQAAGDAALARLATREAEALFQSALDAAREARLDEHGRVDLLDRIGRARSARGEYATAAEAHRAALSLASDTAAAARQTLRLGWLAYYQHEPERAVSLAREAEAGGDASTRGEGLLLQAKLAHAMGRTEWAAGQVLQAGRLAGPETGPEVRALEVAIANHRAHFGEAILRFEGAVDTLHRAGLLRPLATLMLHGGIALAGRGNYTRALAVLTESATFCQQAGAEHLEARVPNTLGTIYHELGQPTRAAELHLESAALAERTGLDEALAHARIGLAELSLDAGDLAQARQSIEAARHIVHDPLVFYSWRARLRWQLARGRLALLEGRLDDALQAAQAVLTEAKATASPKYEVLALVHRGQVLGPRDGLADLRSAVRLARRLEAPPLVYRAVAALARAVPGAERARLQRLASDTAEALASPLPDDLRRAFLARQTVLP